MGMKQRLAHRLRVSLSPMKGWAWTPKDPPGTLSSGRSGLSALGSCLPVPAPGPPGPALTDVVKTSWCQPLGQVGSEEEAGEQGAHEVVAVAGGQRLLPAAVAPAPAQSQLAKERQG